MRDKRFFWLGLISVLLAIALMMVMSISCKPENHPLKLADQIVFVTHDDGQTEIMLICLNLSDRYVLRISADVTVKHMQTDEIFDCINVWIGNIEPRGMKKFSAWTDKLTFGDDVGVRAKFNYRK